MAVIAKIFITDQISLSYAYDFGINQGSQVYFGGHEVSLGFYFSRKTAEKTVRKPRYLNSCAYCPR
jgi:hypothetical protein